MNPDISSLSLPAQKIFKLLSEKATNTNEFQVINKNQFSGETLESFFSILAELRLSGLVSFQEEYAYTPYENFGDVTSKQYGKMDIFLKIDSK
jgi:hypothetical protein